MTFVPRAIVGFVVLAGLGACGPTVPEHPTWAADVRPIVIARCVRCHAEPGRTDPTTGIYKVVPGRYSFDFQTFAEIPSVNLMALVTAGDYARGGYPPAMKLPVMPLAPAEPLDDWQIETFDRWALNPQ